MTIGVSLSSGRLSAARSAAAFVINNGKGLLSMPSAHDELDSHCRMVASQIHAGRVVPFLGAGVNLCGRPRETTWSCQKDLPCGADLATHLATRFECPAALPRDLARVAQFVEIMNGSGPLYEELRDIFNIDYEPTSVHNLLAAIPKILREKSEHPKYQLIVTTNYDDTLEQAFINTKEEFDLVFYMLEDDHQGRFFHRLPNGRQYPIDIPNEYGNLSLDLRTIILKIHGAINRSNPEEDSFVIIEDHYIDFLTSADISKLMPVTLVAKLRKCNFLFLGYSLCDWNFRVILRRINIERNHSFNSWSVQLYLDAFEQEYWARQGVRIFEVDLDEYVLQLSKYL